MPPRVADLRQLAEAGEDWEQAEGEEILAKILPRAGLGAEGASDTLDVGSDEDELPTEVDPEEVIFGSHKPFSELGLEDERLLRALPLLGFTGSTRVQAAAIPMILAEDRRAVVISAETGSGKTLAYLLPAFELALRRGPRPLGCPCPTALVLVPGRELGHQVAGVASRLAAALEGLGGPEISVHSARRGWPERAPDILVTTPRAAAQGLLPCGSEDEVARREALERVRRMELLVFDEADLLLGGGSQVEDVRAVLVALSASYPNKPREVLPEAQVFYKGGVPVEVLDEVSLEWRAGHAQSNADGTFNVRFGPGNWEKYVSRSRLRGPGIGLLVEHGPHIVMACATLPTFQRSRFYQGVQDNKLFNSGIGSPDWIIKRWFPNAMRIQSEWIHRRHPCIVQQDWIRIEGEQRKGERRNLPLRIQHMVELLRTQDPHVRTLVFANTPDACLAAEMALRAEGIGCCGMHAGVPFDERLQGLRRFGRGEVTVLICTDLAARGIDLPVCRHVLQLEFAKNTVDHLHRVGRAARAGRLSKTTNLWGEGDVPVRDAVMQAPAMGLDGELLTRTGNRGRLRRTRKKQRRQEHGYADVRKRARLARAHTQPR